MKIYSIQPVTDGYSKSEINGLTSQLEGLGFKYQQGQFGGGPVEIPKQIIAWLSVNSGWISSIANLTILIGILSKWYAKHKKPAQKQKTPVINISIYNQDIYKSNIEINISKPYSKSEIKKIIDDLEL